MFVEGVGWQQTVSFYWPKFSLEKLLKKLDTRPSNRLSGIACSYVRWSSKAGIKMYMTKVDRDHSVVMQKRAYKLGAAPRCGEPFEFETISVVPRDLKKLEDFHAPLPWRALVYCYWTEHGELAGRTTQTERSDLRVRLRESGIWYHDLWRGNYRRIEGKLVCIDFDPVSCEVLQNKPERGRLRLLKGRNLWVGCDSSRKLAGKPRTR